MNAFSSRIAEINDILSAVNLLQWDARVMMPPGGAATRGQQIATLKAKARELLLEASTEDAAETVMATSGDERERAAVPSPAPARSPWRSPWRLFSFFLLDNLETVNYS